VRRCAHRAGKAERTSEAQPHLLVTSQAECHNRIPCVPDARHSLARADESARRGTRAPRGMPSMERVSPKYRLYFIVRCFFAVRGGGSARTLEPRAGPMGGAGLALPAVIANLMYPATFAAMLVTHRDPRPLPDVAGATATASRWPSWNALPCPETNAERRLARAGVAAARTARAWGRTPTTGAVRPKVTLLERAAMVRREGRSPAGYESNCHHRYSPV